MCGQAQLLPPFPFKMTKFRILSRVLSIRTKTAVSNFFHACKQGVVREILEKFPKMLQMFGSRNSSLVKCAAFA